MEKSDLITIYSKAEEIANQLTCLKGYMDNISITETGDIEVKYSYYSHGDTNYDTVYLTFEDILQPADEVVKKYKQIELDKLQKEKEEREIRKKEEDERKRIADQEAEKALYERLKKKFE